MRQFEALNQAWDPVVEGTIRTFNFRQKGREVAPEVESSDVPWQMDVRWAGGGWTEIVGVRIGRAEGVAFDGGTSASRDIPPDAVTAQLQGIAPSSLAKIAGDAERHRQDYETSQRVAMVWRDIHSGQLERDEAPKRLGGREFDMLGSHAGVHDDVRLAASLYRLFLDIGSRRPTEDVAAATRVSRATAARRIADARRAGLLGDARRGASGEFGTGRGH